MARSLFIKVLFIGEGGVGKTSLILRYLKRDEAKATITKGIEVFTIDRGNVKVLLWDVGGQERFKQLSKNRLLDKALIGVLVFDLSRPNTLNKLLEDWINDPYIKKIPLKILVANKLDLSRMNIDDLSNGIISEINAKKFFITSAKNGYGVDELFNYIMSIVETIATNLAPLAQ